MEEIIWGIVAGILTVVANELRRKVRTKNSLTPPPPGLIQCKTCFFFEEYKRLTRPKEQDTQLLEKHRKGR